MFVHAMLQPRSLGVRDATSDSCPPLIQSFPGIPNFIHPTGGESVGRALNELRKESLDVYNRLHSIEEDISFVNEVHKAYPGFPILRKPHKLQ